MKEKESLSLPEAYLFFDGAFGNVVPFDLIKADPDSYSSIFCEGSVELRRLLKDLWGKGIETRGCCIGHEKVHYYVKESLFGKKYKYIDEQTYRAHVNSKRYRDIETEGHAYLAFRPGELGAAEDLRKRIEKGMLEQLPDLQYATHAFPALVIISLDKYVPKEQREKFFAVLSFVLHRDIFHDNYYSYEQSSNNPSEDKKLSLSETIKLAEQKASLLQSNTKKMSPELNER